MERTEQTVGNEKYKGSLGIISEAQNARSVMQHITSSENSYLLSLLLSKI
jgi:hypothetical protein